MEIIKSSKIELGLEDGSEIHLIKRDEGPGDEDDEDEDEDDVDIFYGRGIKKKSNGVVYEITEINYGEESSLLTLTEEDLRSVMKAAKKLQRAA